MKQANKIILLATLCGISVFSKAQTLSGRVVSKEDGRPVVFASVTLKESHLYAFTDEDGRFAIHHVPEGPSTAVITCLGYAEQMTVVTITSRGASLMVRLSEDNLQLDEVEIVAHRKKDATTTSYTIDRTTIDNQQIMNLSDISQLLPGGKTINPSLINDNRLALRSTTSERGNASFGTAIEIDGIRLNINATMGETSGTSTRSIGMSNVESVEVIPGIPSVEYGDLTNGIVKVNPRKGRSPFIVEGSINQHTQQISLNKGWDIGADMGVLNLSLEHARSFSDAASPYTAYQRNAWSLHYMNVLMKDKMPLTLNIGLGGNIGGYDSQSDPDEHIDSYQKVRDNSFNGNLHIDWLLNKSWITSLGLTASISYADKLSESYTNESSASTQPYIHTLTEGYYIAEDYEQNPSANIILGPTGYWYLRGYTDSKPIDYSLKLKARWNHSFGRVRNYFLTGIEWAGSKNNGRGTYYEDMQYAPTWREYRYDLLPAMNNIALYVENKTAVPLTKRQTIEFTAGLRQDITIISKSEYGKASSLSPRLNSRYTFLYKQKNWISSLSLHAGWGKSVKLPSFQVLYPAPSYRDMLAFSSTSDAQNRSYYAYYTYPSQAQYNPDLKWQYSHQWDLGIEMSTKLADVSLSYFYNKTFNPYMRTTVYSPFTYRYTSPAELQLSGIAAANRQFSIDSQTGIVTVKDITGVQSPVTLGYEERNTYITNSKYVNASPLSRYGIEWIVSFKQIRALRTQIRFDGKYYHYKAKDETLFADVPLGLTNRQSDGQPYQYIGYYLGGSASSTSYAANASVTNGSIKGQVDLNATLTTHIPKIRLIVALRLESSLYNYNRATSSRGYVVESSDEYFGELYDGTSENKTIVVFPEYYSTWSNPEELIPFAEMFLWAQQNDRNLYNDLAQLVVRSNYPYTMNPNRISAFWSANFNITKEIGNHVSVSFYANNFLNTLKQVYSSQTDLYTSLFGSSYIPSFYYGLSLRIKI